MKKSVFQNTIAFEIGFFHESVISVVKNVLISLNRNLHRGGILIFLFYFFYSSTVLCNLDFR